MSLAAMASQTRCHDVVVLDMRGRSPVTDFFIIATGTSDRQMRTVSDELSDHGAGCGFKPFRRSGDESANWILIDFVGVVAHIFSESSRAFYDLETLWDNCPRVDWQALAHSAEEVAAAVDTPAPALPSPAANAANPVATEAAVDTLTPPTTPAPQAADIGPVMDETSIEMAPHIEDGQSPAQRAENKKPAVKRRSVAAKALKKIPSRRKPPLARPKLKKPASRTKAKPPAPKPALKKTRRGAKAAGTAAVSAGKPPKAARPRAAKRPSTLKKAPALRRKSR